MDRYEHLRLGPSNEKEFSCHFTSLPHVRENGGSQEIVSQAPIAAMACILNEFGRNLHLECE
jgi:hypothetical protein